DRKGNLYKLWNRLSSGTYFPPPVRAVEIPKKAGGSRTLGVPTVADRVAQTVVRMYLEPEVEPLFHPDSYGYRPGRSALDAVGECRKRCWKFDWVIDLDLRAFFDSIDHDLLLSAVSKHTDLRWVLLYVKRWLEAPLQREDGTIVARDRGTPQGSAISPLLANLFLHYAFDRWIARHFPGCPFERYADDAVIHCRSRIEATRVLAALSERMADVGLELHPDKTRIVYCKDADRRGSHEHERFDFLGYTFRPRLSKSKHGKHFVNFSPAVSDDARKAISREIRSWHIVRRSDKTLTDLARMFNPIVSGWINYYGRFYKSWLYPVLRHINDGLVRWVMRKYKRLRGHYRRAKTWLAGVARRDPRLFAHWKLTPPDGWTMGAG
ncbi:MAG: group II intron reverse transcriptase/maturase, partial [Gammaproteobacteria bacterium]